MRERMFATLGIWFALALAIDRILANLRYTISLPPAAREATIPGGDTITTWTPMFETHFVEPGMQIALFSVLVLLILVSFLSTAAIWRHAHVAEQERAAAREYEKSKRDREARVRRLLSTMDEDDLSALEEQHIGDDGERVSVTQLLQGRRG